MYAAGWKELYTPGSPQSNPPKAGRFIWVPPPGGGQPIYRNYCTNVIRYVNLPSQPYRAPSPAAPAVASQTIIDKMVGWNTRAYSKVSFQSYGRARFKVPRNVSGAVVGLNDTPGKSGYGDIRFAFYCSYGIVRVMQLGAEVAYIGQYDEGAVFGIRRYKGKIYYEIDGEVVHESNNADMPLFLDAALYTSGDSVEDAEIAGLSYSEGTLSGMQGFASELASSQAVTALQALTGGGREGVRLTTTLTGFVGQGSDKPYGASTAALPLFSGDAQGGGLLAPQMSVSDGSLLMFGGAASGLTGEIGGSAASLSLRFDGMASENLYGESMSSLPALVGSSSGGEGANNASMFSAVTIQNIIQTEAELVIVMNSDATIAGVMAVQVVQDASVLSTGQASTPFAIDAVLEALMYSHASSNSIAPAADDAQTVWVVNTDLQASTRYENYAFNSFAVINGVYYGAKADGLYRLDGDDDNGDPIQAMISMGKMDFGTNLKKSLTNVYVGTSSSGKLFLKVLVDGQEYTYSARASSESMKVQRFDTGRGIRANYLEFELYNAAGDDFELDSVEFIVATLTRRI
jgi:hypothetical protein